MSDSELFFNTHSHNSTNLQGIYQADLWSDESNPSYFSIGIHPEKAASEVIKNQDFERFIIDNHFLAIGEIGLDNRFPNFNLQEEIYIQQLQFAEQFQKPVILHCVNTWDRCRFLHQKHTPNTILIYHGFNKASIIDQVLSYEKSMLSIGASVLTNIQLQKVLENVPLSRLLLETDDSNISIEEIYQKVAKIKSLDLRDFSEQIRKNVKLIFGI